MFSAIANLLSMIIGLTCTVVWIVSLAQTDGKPPPCDPKECDTCPFPCEGHDTNIKTERKKP